ncbi:hypothetical protein DPMN_152456 [Dreissena polymorpha]|uniref:Mab-21-like HhH/H2TH-like domain-containing protein n=1 Tax=Dreissena polymorpha TaxID=45954 RepID=A0A9D4FKF5_DREPO|nr:hypothetical protein DPMN_152456 [Dreissena polymorpha]
MDGISVKLSQVMADIGVAEDMVNFRRYVYLNGIVNTFFSSTSEMKCIVAGSQREGSTTPGLMSDVDCIMQIDIKADFFPLPDQYKYRLNLYKDKALSFPQCCSVYCAIQHGKQMWPLMKRDMSKLNIGPQDNYCVSKGGRILITNGFLMAVFQSTTFKQRGPAFKVKNNDFVIAEFYKWLPFDCLVLFTRPKPGHWPKQTFFTKARKCGVFLILPGNISHAFAYDSNRQTGTMNVKYPSEYVSLQWRVSTTQMERLLMLDLNIQQLKTYIITKMIRKQFLQPVVDDMLNTFHMKTAFLFTVEHFPEELWRDDNLVQCVVFCLKTLRRFLKRRYCPHYTNARVNLFANKLQARDCQALIEKITHMINSKLICIYDLHIDDVGARLAIHPDTSAKLASRIDNRSTIVTELTRRFLLKPFNIISFMCMSGKKHFEHVLKWLHICLRRYKRGEYRSVLNLFVHQVQNTIASMEASSSIANGRHVSKGILDKYQSSLRSGNVANYLKYASMFACTKQFNRAESLLAKVESIITPDMALASTTQFIKIRIEDAFCPPIAFLQCMSKLLFDVYFTRHEANCVSMHLQYEMYATSSDGDTHNRSLDTDDLDMANAIVSPVPFLYYLQYLSARQRNEQKVAKSKLEKYCTQCVYGVTERTVPSTFNMFGHILELEGQLHYAWIAYIASIQVKPQCSAAYWHLFD